MNSPSNPWNEIFRERGRVFCEPHEDMPQLERLLEAAHAPRLLDLGSGTGRHVVHFARRGLAVWGLDNAPEGLRATAEWLRQEHLSATLLQQNMFEPLPFADGFFDAVLSIRVIHHADLATIRKIVQEVVRVLRPGGWLFITVPQTQKQATAFQAIEPNTLIPLNGPEKGLPHHYFTPAELTEVFGAFEIASIHVDSTTHYCLLGRKR